MSPNEMFKNLAQKQILRAIDAGEDKLYLVWPARLAKSQAERQLKSVATRINNQKLLLHPIYITLREVKLDSQDFAFAKASLALQGVSDDLLPYCEVFECEVARERPISGAAAEATARLREIAKLLPKPDESDGYTVI